MTRILFATLFLILCAPSLAQNISTIDQINKYIEQGKCSDAEAYTRSYIPPPTMQTILGMISNDCKKNRTEAIGYYKIAAAQGEAVAIEMLAALGISYTISSNNKVGSVQSEIIQSPPPHIYSPPPRPRDTNIIVIQPQVVVPTIIQPSFNAATCIQDGGGTYCPNHPNTQFRPFKW